MAKELLLTGRRIKAARALEIGLVNAVFPAGELAGAAAQMAQEIAERSPVAIRATKTSVTLGEGADMETALSIEITEFANCFGSDDQREGMAAFAEKRPARPFTGAAS
jgi:enoyl-CoA hydratase